MEVNAYKNLSRLPNRNFVAVNHTLSSETSNTHMDKVSEFNLVHALSKQIVREHQTVKVLSASNWDGEINQYEKQAAEEV